MNIFFCKILLPFRLFMLTHGEARALTTLSPASVLSQNGILYILILHQNTNQAHGAHCQVARQRAIAMLTFLLASQKVSHCILAIEVGEIL